MKTQAWGWLAMAVLAAGLNASYHDGGLQWLHRAVDQMEHSSAAVLALAAGHTDQFLAEARLVSSQSSAGQVSSDETASGQNSPDQLASDQIASDQTASNEISVERVASKKMERDENRSCPWARAMARVHSKVARMGISFAQLEAESDGKQADFDRLQARRERLQAQIVAQTDRWRATAAAFNPVVMKAVEIPAHCQGLQKLVLQRESLRNQTIRISLPRIPNPAVPTVDLPQVFAPEIHVDMASAGPA
jgi:hypothetical protein